MGKKITGQSPAKTKKAMATSATAGKKPNEKIAKNRIHNFLESDAPLLHPHPA